MDKDIFFAQFGHLAQGPGGIKKLRDLILQLAVQGKLVEQNPDDEPASVLLEKIAIERQQRILAKAISKYKINAIDDSVVQHLPTGWEIAQLGSVYDVRDGTHDTPKYVSKGIPLITSKNLSKGSGLDFSNVKYISQSDHEEISKRSGVDEEDILFAMIGSIGNATVIERNCDFSIKNVALFKPVLSELYVAAYLKCFLDAYTPTMINQAAGGVQKFVSLTYLRSFAIAIPPLAEQKRIVAKVDELMGLCDELEAQQNEHVALKRDCVASTLHHLTAAAEPDEINTNWSITQNNFHNWFNAPQTVKTLRATILQLAVQGKLVPQADDVRWAESTFKDTFQTIDGDRGPNYPKKSDYSDQGHCLFLSTKNVRPTGFLFDETVFISEEKHNQLRKGTIERGDVIITTRGTIGNCAFYSDEIVHDLIRINSGMLILRPYENNILGDYLTLFIQSPLFKQQVAVNKSGSAQPQLPAKILKEFSIAIPPLAEQSRIVAKVDELMALCDQLEAQIATQSQLTQDLTASLIHHMTAA